MIAKLPWWCRRIISSLGISYYGWKLIGIGGQSQSASYCYAIWHKHLTMAQQHGVHGHPNTLVELGPGHFLGVGLAPLLSGTNPEFLNLTDDDSTMRSTFLQAIKLT
ncbi:hypothetical protein [Nitrospira sp. Nam74]